MNRMQSILMLAAGALVLMIGAAVFAVLNFFAYVAPDQLLVVIRKSGAALPSGQKIAEPGQKGIQREALGPGVYFFNPLVYDWEKFNQVVVPAGDPTTWEEVYTGADPDLFTAVVRGSLPKVGVVTSLAGKPAPPGVEVVDEGFQGIQKRVLTPGTYRLNPLAYKVELADATFVPVGCVGVVTSQLGEMPGVEVVREAAIGPDGQPIVGHDKVIQKLATEGKRGVLANVLTPGIYYLNPYLYKVKIVQVGYNQIEQLREHQAQSETIAFPSKDGFTIEVEVTVVWGRHPEHTAGMINRMGDLPQIKQIILSQIRSICRNLGSDYNSIDFIRGEKRELYQRAVTETLQRVAREKDIEILIALIHNIEVRPNSASRDAGDLKRTIQLGFIAKEQELTKQAQRETASKQAELEAAKAQIEVAREQVTAATRRKVAELLAEGHKKAEEINAQRDLEVARIEREIAKLEAERTRRLGKAEADVARLAQQAEADGKKLLVSALGDGAAYNLYTFARNFQPDDIRLIFAGPGTLWTNLRELDDLSTAEILKEATDADVAPKTP